MTGTAAIAGSEVKSGSVLAVALELYTVVCVSLEHLVRASDPAAEPDQEPAAASAVELRQEYPSVPEVSDREWRVVPVPLLEPEPAVGLAARLPDSAPAADRL